MLKLKLQYFGYLMRIADSLAKTLMLGKTEGKMKRGQQTMKSLESITDQWTCTELTCIETVGDRGFRGLLLNMAYSLASKGVSLVAQLCPTLCDHMDRSTPGLPVHQQLLELAQTPLSS